MVYKLLTTSCSLVPLATLWQPQHCSHDLICTPMNCHFAHPGKHSGITHFSALDKSGTLQSFTYVQLQTGIYWCCNSPMLTTGDQNFWIWPTPLNVLHQSHKSCACTAEQYQAVLLPVFVTSAGLMTAGIESPRSTTAQSSLLMTINFLVGQP